MPRSPRLSFELLETFVTLVESDGDASRAASTLEINQPSMSKRLAQLQTVGASIRSPWLERRGKRWLLTAEGRRVLAAVQGVVHRYRALGDFARGGLPGAPDVTLACGQHAAVSYVADALRQFRLARPDARFRLSTRRGRARIEGVANGTFDLATVSAPEDEIRTIARRSLHIDHLFDDPLVLVAGLAARGPWADEFQKLPVAPTPAEALARFPLLLPEPDAGVRRDLDRDLAGAGVAGRLQVVLEAGGWPTILHFVRDGVGVGIVSRAACAAVPGLLPVRPLNPAQFRPIRHSLIARKHHQGGDQRDLSDDAECLFQSLIQSGRSQQTKRPEQNPG